MNHKIFYPLIKSMPMSGISPQHSSYMLANQQNERHSQLINLNGGATRRKMRKLRKGGNPPDRKYKTNNSTRTRLKKTKQKKTKTQNKQLKNKKKTKNKKIY